MIKEELEDVFSKHSTVIIAAAGHGKTEMIVDMVEYAEGKQLLLTHTHAGVDALQKRLARRGVSKLKYSISTIASFCVKWGMSYRNTADVDTMLSPYSNKDESQKYYNQFYNGAKSIFIHDWAGKILKATYSGIIVDEYQDCIQTQHELFLMLTRHLPVRVLGDPLQGIFSFGGEELVDWNNIGYPESKVKTIPWRWKDTNPALGQYLNEIRVLLWPALTGEDCTINIDSCNGSISFIDPQAFNVYSMLNEFRQYRTVLYITKWEAQQKKFCQRHPGIFQLDEKQECEDLFHFAKSFSNNTNALLMFEAIEFASKCFTKVNAELAAYKKRLANSSFDFKRITKHQDFGQLLEELQSKGRHEILLNVLNWFEKNPEFKCYRKELFREMVRSIDYAHSHNLSIFESAERIRKDPLLQKRYADFKFLSSRTLLSKGLEFDCVIIDMTTPLSAKEFYVAMTRAMKKIYIISPSVSFCLK